MKILIESHIPYIKGLLEPFAQVEYLEPQQFTSESVADADALIIRTRTYCNASLLDGSRCQFIGTATIGTDHIDLDYCKNRGITVCNAAGCNAPAVAQYVLASIYQHMQAKHIASPESLTVGVVGVGHVGSIVARFAKECGFKVLLCDPPRAEREGGDQFTSLSHICAEADIITFHTPLTKQGEHATYHICNEKMLGNLGKCSLLINSARGPIVETEALLKHLRTNDNLSVAIDCWEGEPNINPDLLQRAFIATPHIAGYSAEGKKRGTAMVIEQLNAHFGWNAVPQSVADCTPTTGARNASLSRIAASYNPLTDTEALRTNPQDFEAIRNHYALRHEVESAE